VNQEDPRAAVSNALVAVMKELYGKGPSRARSYFNDDYLFVVMEGGLLSSEERMLEAGEEDLVRGFRLRFQEVAAPQITAAVERVTGRGVVTYHSQVLFHPTRVFEIFLLGGPSGPR
jgi:uncharacterized protein YbcI